MILVEIGRIVFAVPFLVAWLDPNESFAIEIFSDISLLLVNYFWIALAINISGHFSFFKTQLALKSDPVGYKKIAEKDNNFQRFIDISIGLEILIALVLVIVILIEHEQTTIHAMLNSTQIILTLYGLVLIIISFCGMAKYFQDIPKHEKR